MEVPEISLCRTLAPANPLGIWIGNRSPPVLGNGLFEAVNLVVVSLKKIASFKGHTDRRRVAIGGVFLHSARPRYQVHFDYRHHNLLLHVPQ